MFFFGLSVCLSVCWSVCLSVCTAILLCVCLSVSLSAFLCSCVCSCVCACARVESCRTSRPKTRCNNSDKRCNNSHKRRAMCRCTCVCMLFTCECWSHVAHFALQHVCCSVLQCVAVCCSNTHSATNNVTCVDVRVCVLESYVSVGVMSHILLYNTHSATHNVLCVDVRVCVCELYASVGVMSLVSRNNTHSATPAYHDVLCVFSNALCNSLQLPATHCNSLQHTLQHTTTHCNTRGPRRAMCIRTCVSTYVRHSVNRFTPV